MTNPEYFLAFLVVACVIAAIKAYSEQAGASLKEAAAVIEKIAAGTSGAGA